MDFYIYLYDIVLAEITISICIISVEEKNLFHALSQRRPTNVKHVAEAVI